MPNEHTDEHKGEEMTASEEEFSRILEEMSAKGGFDIKNDKETSSKYQLKKVNQMHREIIRFLVLGYKDKEIAEALGCTSVTVRNVKESELAQRYINGMQEERDAAATDLSTTIKNIAPLALDISTGIMIDEQTSAAVRANIAQDLLDRAGYKPANVNMNLGDKLTKEEIHEITQRARANGVKVRDDYEGAEEATYTEEPKGGDGDGDV